MELNHRRMKNMQVSNFEYACWKCQPLSWKLTASASLVSSMMGVKQFPDWSRGGDYSLNPWSKRRGYRPIADLQNSQNAIVWPVYVWGESFTILLWRNSCFVFARSKYTLFRIEAYAQSWEWTIIRQAILLI